MTRNAYTEGVGMGWYGKLPASGDFVHRGMSRSLVQWWDRWLLRGVGSLQRGGRDSEALYRQAPFWNFVIPSGLDIGLIQLGCIGPSRDRVGRCFPLTLVCAVPQVVYRPDVLAGSAAYYRCLGVSMLGALRHSRNAGQLDDSLRGAETVLNRLLMPAAATVSSANGGGDILSVLNGGHEIAPLAAAPDELGWADLPLYFNEASVTSYWWTNAAEGAAHRTLVHAGALNATLFDRLFQAGLR